jgi:hypothetical protein
MKKSFANPLTVVLRCWLTVYLFFDDFMSCDRARVFSHSTWENREPLSRWQTARRVRLHSAGLAFAYRSVVEVYRLHYVRDTAVTDFPHKRWNVTCNLRVIDATASSTTRPMRISSSKKWAMAAALVCVFPLAASALSITYAFAGANPNSGQAVNASATFTTGAGTVGVTLNNLLSNPTDVSQLISDLRFTVGGLATTGASLSSSSGIELTVNANDTYSVGAAGSTGWALSSPAASTLYLNVLGTAVGPEHLIIGGSSNGTFSGGTYSNANGSIGGNAAHNPFLESGATFNIALAGVTTATTITSAAFSFGTTPGLLEAPGVPASTPGVGVPDGGQSVLLLGLALMGLGAFARYKRV